MDIPDGNGGSVSRPPRLLRPGDHGPEAARGLLRWVAAYHAGAGSSYSNLHGSVGTLFETARADAGQDDRGR